MFIISTPKDFTLGDTIPVKINGHAATLTWRDEDTLVIDGTDARTIFLIHQDDKMFSFTCSDGADEESLGLPLHYSEPL